MMDTSALTTYRMLCDQYQSSRRRNEQMRRDSERLKAIFIPVSTDKLETLKVQLSTCKMNILKFLFIPETVYTSTPTRSFRRDQLASNNLP